MPWEMKCISWICMMSQLFLQLRGQTWWEFEGHCYTIPNVKDTFTSCRNACSQYGSYAVELDTELELTFLRAMINSTSDQYWVGLNYSDVSKKFTWERSRQEPGSSMWMPTEPNLTGLCVRLATESQTTGTAAGTIYMLADNPCTSLYKIVCEKEAVLTHPISYREVVIKSSNRCPMAGFHGMTKLFCAIKCARNKFCLGFQFNDQLKICTPYQFAVACATAQASTLKLYNMEILRC